MKLNAKKLNIIIWYTSCIWKDIHEGINFGVTSQQIVKLFCIPIAAIR